VNVLVISDVRLPEADLDHVGLRDDVISEVRDSEFEEVEVTVTLAVADVVLEGVAVRDEVADGVDVGDGDVVGDGESLADGVCVSSGVSVVDGVCERLELRDSEGVCDLLKLGVVVRDRDADCVAEREDESVTVLVALSSDVLVPNVSVRVADGSAVFVKDRVCVGDMLTDTVADTELERLDEPVRLALWVGLSDTLRVGDAVLLHDCVWDDDRVFVTENDSDFVVEMLLEDVNVRLSERLVENEGVRVADGVLDKVSEADDEVLKVYVLEGVPVCDIDCCCDELRLFEFVWL
jgi:hypothetical protein